MQPGLRRLELAAVAASAFRIEEQVVLLQHLRHVGLERDEIRRILDVAADRNRAGDVAMNQSERAAEQIDARGDERRADAVVVEHQRLDQVIGVAAVIRRVDDAVAARGGDDVMQVFVLAFDLAENRIERMLQRAIEPVSLRGAQLFEIRENPLASLFAAFAISPEVLDDLFASQDGLSDFIQHGESDYTTPGDRRKPSDRLAYCIEQIPRRRPAAEVPRSRRSMPSVRGPAPT